MCSHCVIDLIYSFHEHSYSVDNRKDLLQEESSDAHINDEVNGTDCAMPLP